MQKNVLAWRAFQFIKWGWDGSTGAPQFVRLPAVSTKERLWMVQTLLDEYPDNFELPDSLSASELTTLRAQRSYRMFGRTQFRYLLGSSGSIEQSSVVAIRNECDNGPTKFAYLGDFLQGSITVKGVEVDFSGNLSQSFIASEPLPGNGAITIGADSRALSFYFGGRVGLEGRVPNYALFSRDAPFIFTEMIFALGADGRDTGSRIRFSVNKTWSPSGTTGTAHFNEIRIYSRDYGTGGTSFTRVAPVFEIAGQLDAFIQSGDRTWPGAAPLPEIR
ncbi:hypothetical protein [Oleiharenicola sp. Vm1]|uniref:hypothetical protein n=1 Tax=Oleiharenicola sp. Vm1 TaxID=3398393 RepID=UPI0039F63657